MNVSPAHPANSKICFCTITFPGDREHDLTGQIFSHLTVIGYFGPKNLNNYWPHSGLIS